jgi:hypothetical protein
LKIKVFFLLFLICISAKSFPMEVGGMGGMVSLDLLCAIDKSGDLPLHRVLKASSDEEADLIMKEFVLNWGECPQELQIMEKARFLAALKQRNGKGKLPLCLAYKHRSKKWFTRLVLFSHCISPILFRDVVLKEIIESRSNIVVLNSIRKIIRNTKDADVDWVIVKRKA